MFDIHFLERKSQDETPIAVGIICLGEFTERFESPLSFWNMQAYISQWKNGVRRLVDGHAESCLITSPPQQNSWVKSAEEAEKKVAQISLKNHAPTSEPADPLRLKPQGFHGETPRKTSAGAS